MKRVVLLFLLCAIFCELSACARTRKLMFWNKDKQESPAFVDEKNPLAVPPEYNVRPVVPSSVSAEE